MAEKCDFGLIGLAVMGENLALNVESRGYSVAVFNRTVSKVDNLPQPGGIGPGTQSAAQGDADGQGRPGGG